MQTLPAFSQARHSFQPGRLARPLFKFALLPLLLALPAFHLHQHIAYGSGLGEWYAYGPLAYARALAIWWGAWVLGVLLMAAGMRVLIESAAWLSAHWSPALAQPVRLGAERLGLAVLYLGLPLLLALRLLAS